jgi:hypothetical protein
MGSVVNRAKQRRRRAGLRPGSSARSSRGDDDRTKLLDPGEEVLDQIARGWWLGLASMFIGSFFKPGHSTGEFIAQLRNSVAGRLDGTRYRETLAVIWLIPMALFPDGCRLVMARHVPAIGRCRLSLRMAGTAAGHDGWRGQCPGPMVSGFWECRAYRAAAGRIRTTGLAGVGAPCVSSLSVCDGSRWGGGIRCR